MTGSSPAISTKTYGPGIIVLAALFTASLVTANLLGSKLVTLFDITVSVGLFIFPFTFLVADIAAEVYGKPAARTMVLTGIAVQIYVLFFVWMGGQLPAAPRRDLTQAYEEMFSLTPRMVLASVVAYTFSMLLDVRIFVQLRERLGRRWLWARTNAATLVSQAVDTAIFMTIFLGGVLSPWDLFKASLVSYATKLLVAALDTPFVYLGVSMLSRFDPTVPRPERAA